MNIFIPSHQVQDFLRLHLEPGSELLRHRTLGQDPVTLHLTPLAPKHLDGN